RSACSGQLPRRADSSTPTSAKWPRPTFGSRDPWECRSPQRVNEADTTSQPEPQRVRRCSEMADVVSLIEQDHREVEGLFARFEQGDTDVVATICEELDRHTAGE